MNDNTQELDEILNAVTNFTYDAMAHRGDPLVGTLPTMDKATAKQAILDWHNKQVDYVIGEEDDGNISVLRKFLPEDEARRVSDRNYTRNFLRAEQRQRAERNKLKENTDE